MKITENSPFINLDAYTRNIEEKKKLDLIDKHEAKGVLGRDRVLLSEIGKRVQEAKKAIDAVPDIREQKITHIKMQIEDGNYKIKAERIAARILRESFINENFKAGN